MAFERVKIVINFFFFLIHVILVNMMFVCRFVYSYILNKVFHSAIRITFRVCINTNMLVLHMECAFL